MKNVKKMERGNIVRIGVFCALAAGSVRGADTPPVVETVGESARKHEVVAPPKRGGARHAAITIEAGDRMNAFLVPHAHSETMVKGNKGGGAKPTAGGGQERVKDPRPFLEETAARIQKAEKAFEQGRYGELPPAKDVASWPPALEKLPVEKPEDVDVRGVLLQRAQSLSGKISAREAFLQRGYAVHFVIVNEGSPERSVASIGGKIVRAQDSFDDGVVVQEIRRDGVLVGYKGLKFALPMVRMQR